MFLKISLYYLFTKSVDQYDAFRLHIKIFHKKFPKLPSILTLSRIMLSQTCMLSGTADHHNYCELLWKIISQSIVCGQHFCTLGWVITLVVVELIYWTVAESTPLSLNLRSSSLATSLGLSSIHFGLTISYYSKLCFELNSVGSFG